VVERVTVSRSSDEERWMGLQVEILNRKAMDLTLNKLVLGVLLRL
jgi:hypothetical protein